MCDEDSHQQLENKTHLEIDEKVMQGKWNSTGSVSIVGVVILESPRAVNPEKGPQHVLFDANFCVVKGSEKVTMGLLCYFASNEMANEIQKMADKLFQRAFLVTNIHYVPVPLMKMKY